MSRALGCRPSETDEHIRKFPLTTATLPSVPTPSAVGVNWYSNFDSPVKLSDGRWWVGRGNLGSIRGGHCVMCPTTAYTDADSWWDFYDQGSEGACVGFGASRMMSHLNRKRYMARWLWDFAKVRDEWDDTNPGDDNGTSVRAALEVLRTAGHVYYTSKLATIEASWQARDSLAGNAAEGIAAYRWATNMDQWLAALGSPTYLQIGGVPFHNSWGRDYPRKVWMPLATWARLMNEEGEFGMVTDR